jgi:aminopeptidase
VTNNLLEKYAHLLINYSLNLSEGDKLYVSSTTLAEPLLNALYKVAVKTGVYVEYNMTFEHMYQTLIDEGTDSLIDTIPIFQQKAIHEFDAYLVIRAPHKTIEEDIIKKDKSKRRSNAIKPMFEVYNERTTNGSLKRCLCQYPTQAAANDASMTLEEYSKFIFEACKLFEEDPIMEWKKLGTSQQRIVDFLNKTEHLVYKNKQSEISFSVKGRKWINSDGKTNMPSGEVYTSPIENSVNGLIYFDYPSIYDGKEVSGITLLVEEGHVVKATAEKGQEHLDKILKIDGATQFGEVAIGLNYDIKVATKNILFDEKIGGTIHMAIGQSYEITGGKNKSIVHWDMIADMKQGGEIYADGVKIYENGILII